MCFWIHVSVCVCLHEWAHVCAHVSAWEFLASALLCLHTYLCLYLASSPSPSHGSPSQPPHPQLPTQSNGGGDQDPERALLPGPSFVIPRNRWPLSGPIDIILSPAQGQMYAGLRDFVPVTSALERVSGWYPGNGQRVLAGERFGLIAACTTEHGSTHARRRAPKPQAGGDARVLGRSGPLGPPQPQQKNIPRPASTRQQHRPRGSLSEDRKSILS